MIIVLLCSLLLLSPGGVRARTIEWTKYDNTVPATSDGSSTNGKIPLGTDNTKGDDANVGFPAVITEGSTNKMWYTGHDGAYYRIYYATSTNAGLTWTKYDNGIPAISDGSSTNGKIPLGTTGKGDDIHAYSPFVIQDGSTNKMWYAGFDGSYYRIYYATSTNGGLTWTKYDNTVPPTSDGVCTNGKISLGTSGKGDDLYVIDSSIIQDGSTYQMWYAGHDGANYRIYYATSTNGGLTWTKYDNGIPANSDGICTNGKIPLGTAGKGDDVHARSPFVIMDGSTYKMWYAGNDGANWRIYHATSTDGGLTWTKLNNTIPADSDTTNSNSRLGLGSAPRGDSTNLVDMVVINNSGLDYQMWYTAAKTDETLWRIYHATSLGPPAGTIFTFK